SPSGGDLQVLASVPAVRLFVDRARRVEPAFELTRANAAAIADICTRLDGLPLGIELVAAQVSMLGPAGIRDRLAGHLPPLGPGLRDRPDRQRTLSAAIGWSYRFLDAPAQTLFARLSVFAGGCRLPELAAVCRSADAGADVHEVLASLLEHSLVTTTTDADAVRVRILEPIREYAYEQLVKSGSLDDARLRHAMAYLDLAEAQMQAVPGRGQAAIIERLADERDNFRAAIRWALEVGNVEVGQRLATAL